MNKFKNFILNSIMMLSIAITVFAVGGVVGCKVSNNILETDIEEMVEQNVQLHFDKYDVEKKLKTLEGEMVDCSNNNYRKYDITIEHEEKTINYKKEGLFQKARAEVLNK